MNIIFSFPFGWLVAWFEWKRYPDESFIKHLQDQVPDDFGYVGINIILLVITLIVGLFLVAAFMCAVNGAACEVFNTK